MGTYKEYIINSMGHLALDPKVVFLGEGLIEDNGIYGTMIKVPKDKMIEMPIAENLIVGSAIGLAIAGYKPVVIFQRMDFMLCAADAIINHLSLMEEISGGKCNPCVVIRTILGAQDKKKFDVGLQHSKDLSGIFSPYISTWHILNTMDFDNTYLHESLFKAPKLIIEHKDLYETRLS